MSEPLDQQYFNWLCAKVMYDEPGRSFDLMRILHATEFIWQVPGDESRSEDGKDLRYRFSLELGQPQFDGWDPLGCSILEMLIAFAGRAEFQTDISLKQWFWTMLQNLKLDEYRHVRDSDVPQINHILYVFVWRLYDAWGDGGLWPLNRQPAEDQRGVDIWYQFFAYIEDRAIM
jgi:hypothetical protein